jgi:hypothetical protein
VESGIEGIGENGAHHSPNAASEQIDTEKIKTPAPVEDRIPPLRNRPKNHPKPEISVSAPLPKETNTAPAGNADGNTGKAPLAPAGEKEPGGEPIRRTRGSGNGQPETLTAHPQVRKTESRGLPEPRAYSLVDGKSLAPKQEEPPELVPLETTAFTIDSGEGVTLSEGDWAGKDELSIVDEDGQPEQS